MVSPKVVCIDYDGTFTECPGALNILIQQLKYRNWSVIGCTMRYSEEADGRTDLFSRLVDKLYFTGRTAKRPYLESLGINVTIWIDNQPEYILYDALK
jgi:hypothetical protein